MDRWTVSLPVILRPEAYDDLVQIREWYDSKSFGLGLKFTRRAANSLDLIGEFPELFGYVWKTYRATKIKKHPHVIYYQIFPDYVDVVAVLDGRRNPKIIRNRLES